MLGPPTETLTPDSPNAPIVMAPEAHADPLETSPEIVAPDVAGGAGVGDGVDSGPAVPGEVGDFGVELPHAAARRQTRSSGNSRRGGAVMGALPLPIPPVGGVEAIRIPRRISKPGTEGENCP